MITKQDLYEWCRIPARELPGRDDLKIPFRLVETSEEMGLLMARELTDGIKRANAENRTYNAIIPCGPKCWYEPYARIVNNERISLKNFNVFHMDECYDWECRELAADDPYNFRNFMDKHFYDSIDPELAVPIKNRYYLTIASMDTIRERIATTDIDLTLGGWGQDGHVAYNQASRRPFTHVTLDDLRNSSVRVQENNIDTIIALAHRTYGAAYQFAPPISVTLGMKECLSARRVRIYSDTGAWKQTALRVALFSEPDPEYPMTLLQEHPDALITATLETARHPISENPDWKFRGVNA